MYGRRTASLLMGLALWGSTYATAQAELPDDRISEYYIRETPTDPDSDVLYIVTLELTAVDQNGDEIAWEITEVTLTEPGEGGDTVWVDDAPAPDTPDGYWWLEHADPEHPQDAEFDWPPLLQGTGTAVDPSDDDMEYDFAGDYCDSQCQQLFNGEVGALKYSLTLANEEDPEVEGDDEPVEIEGGTIYG